MRPDNLTFKNPAYEKWIRSKPCLVCKSPEVHGHHVSHARKNSFMLIPLCVNCHTFGKQAYHVLERRRFEDAHSLNLDWCIINYLCEFIEEKK